MRGVFDRTKVHLAAGVTKFTKTETIHIFIQCTHPKLLKDLMNFRSNEILSKLYGAPYPKRSRCNGGFWGDRINSSCFSQNEDGNKVRVNFTGT